MLAECSSLREARSLLLRTEFVDGEGWMTSQAEPSRLTDVPTKQAPLPGDDFELHQELTLPGGRAVHRFALTRSAAAKLHGRIATEAKWLAPWVSFGGVKRSNVGGFHSHEQAFRSRRQPLGAWYGDLLESVLLPALHVLDGGKRPSTIRYEDQIALIEPRIAGWLNRSAAHDFNRLHTHGEDVAWSLVYYVDPGQAAQAAQTDGGALLVKLRPPAASGRTAASGDPESVGQELYRADGGQESGSSDAEGGCYYAIHPAAGELWAFSGDTLHCVMPRALPRLPREASLPLPFGLKIRLPWPDASSDVVPRISVACNVYTVTSSHRDELIGFQEDAASPASGQVHFGCGPWSICAAQRKPAKGSKSNKYR